MKLKNFLWGLGVYLAICGITAFVEEADKLQKGASALAQHPTLANLSLVTFWHSPLFYASMLILSVGWLQWSLVAYLACLDLAPRLERKLILQAAEFHSSKGCVSHFITGGWGCVGFAIMGLLFEARAAGSPAPRAASPDYFHFLSHVLCLGLFFIAIGALAKVRGVTTYLMRQRPAALAVDPEEVAVHSTSLAP